MTDPYRRPTLPPLTGDRPEYDPLRAFNNYRTSVMAQPYKEPSLEGYFQSRGSSPYIRGTAKPTAQGYTPASPPERFQFDLLAGLGEGVMGAAESGLGKAFLGTPPDQRGGSQPLFAENGPRLATAPVNFQNFATYAREGQLSLITSMLGHKYQQPEGEDPYARPVGYDSGRNVLDNIAQGDLEGVLDNVIDGVSAVGSAIDAPFVAMTNWWRGWVASDRAREVRSIAQTGHSFPSLIRFVTHITGLDSVTGWEGIARHAAEQGLDTRHAMTELFDLSPEVVDKILANPQMTDEELTELTRNEPFSYDPASDLIANLVVTLGPMLGAAKVVTTAAKGVGALRAGRAIAAASEGYVPGRLTVTADRIGSWAAQPLWRRSAKVAGALTGYSPTGIKIGAGIRAGEWLFKQIAVSSGNEEMVKAADRWLYEMPLSTSPGLMMLDAFAVHPMQGAKQLYGAARGAAARVAGRGEVPVSDVFSKRMVPVTEADFDTLTPVLERLGWDRGVVDGVFGDGGPLSVTDFKNGLLHIALEKVRQRHEARAARLLPEGTAGERLEAFLREYGDEGAKLLADEISGKSTALTDELRTEFWERAQLIDASELGGEGYVGPYDPATALVGFASWIRFSKLIAKAADDVLVAKLRTDVNLEFVRAYREAIEATYSRPGSPLSQRDLNRLRMFVPESAKVLTRRGDKVPTVTKRQMLKILDDLEREQGVRDYGATRPRNEAVPSLTEAEAADPAAIAKAFRLPQATVEALQRALTEGVDGLGPVPPGLARVLEAIHGLTSEHVRRAPKAAWEQAARWFEAQLQSAVVRGQLVERLGQWRQAMESRAPRGRGAELDLDIEAVKRIEDTLTHPFADADLKDASDRAFADARQADVEKFMDRLGSWLDSEARELDVRRVGEIAVKEIEGPFAQDMLVGDGFDPVRAIPGIEAVLAKVRRSKTVDLLPAEQAILADPAAHPLELVPVLVRAIDEGVQVSKVQEASLRALPDLEGAYGVLADTVLGPDVNRAVDRALVADLTKRALAHAQEYADLRTSARGLAGMLENQPGHGLSDASRAFYERARELGAVKVGKGEKGATVGNWTTVLIEPEGVRAVSNAAELERGRAAIQQLIDVRQKVYDHYSTLLDRQQARLTDTLTVDDFEWTSAGEYKTRKAALEIAKELHDAGIYTRQPVKVGTKWLLERGELKERPLTGATGQIEQAQAAGDAARMAELNKAVEAERGGVAGTGMREGPGEGSRINLDELRAAEETAPPEAATQPQATPGTAPEGAPTPERITPESNLDRLRATEPTDPQWRFLESHGYMLDKLQRDVPPDAPRLRSGYTWEHVPLERVSDLPDLHLIEMRYAAKRLAALADDAEPEFKPKVVKVKGRPGTTTTLPDGRVLEVPEQPAYWTYTTDSLNKADQGGPRKGIFTSAAEAKEGMLEWQADQTATLRRRIADAKHDLPFLEAEIGKREGLPMDAEGRVIQHAGTMADSAGLRAAWNAARDAAWSGAEPQVAKPAMVEAISDTEARTAAAADAYALAQEAEAAAFEAKRAAYQPAVPFRREAAAGGEPGPTFEVVPDPVRPKKWMVRGTGPTGRAFEVVDLTKAEATKIGTSRTVGTDAAVERLGVGLDEIARGEPTPAPREVTFLDPGDNKTPIRARVVLVEAEQLLTSDEAGFPQNLQPRSRDLRIASDEQIKAMAKDLQPDKLVGMTEGGQGTPVVTADGVVLAGNGRTAAIRLALKGEYEKYRARLLEEAVAQGFDPEVIKGMDRPVLVRELVDVSPETMERLAWQLNPTGMAIGDLAAAFAREITATDLEQLRSTAKADLRDTIVSGRNSAVVKRILGRLPPDWVAQYLDPGGNLNEAGVGLVEGAIFAKLLRADDRTLPLYDKARNLVVSAVEQGGEEMRRIFNGVFDGAPEMLKAQNAAEAGTIGREFLGITDRLVEALDDILRRRRDGKSMAQIALDLSTVEAFAEYTLHPVTSHLARIIASSSGEAEIGAFLRAVAKSTVANAEPGLFGDAVPIEASGLLNEGVKAWNEARAAWNEAHPTSTPKELIDNFPSEQAPFDTALTGTRVLEDGRTAPPVVKSQPLLPEELAGEVNSRLNGEPAAQIVEGPDQVLRDVPGEIRFTDPDNARLMDALREDTPAVRADLEDVIDTYGSFKSVKAKRDFLGGIIEGVNDGTATPAEWHFLSQAVAIRRGANGKLNMKPVIRAGLDLDAVRRVLNDLATRSLEQAEPTARVHRPTEQRPISPADYAADTGLPPETVTDAVAPGMAEAAVAGEHTIVVNENPTATGALRAAVGAPKVSDPVRSVIELNAPEPQLAAERLSALRQQALAALEEQRRKLADYEANPPLLPESEVASVFSSPETGKLWSRFMESSGRDQLAPKLGAAEPHDLATLQDAIESIERGVITDPVTGEGLTPSEATQLLGELTRLRDATLERAIAKVGGRRRATTVEKIRPKEPGDFDADLYERMAQVADDLGRIVVNDPSLSPLDGFMGTQYVLSKAPTKNRRVGGPLSPRLPFRDYFATDLIPGLAEEVMSGRVMDLANRVERSRTAAVVDAIAGPRVEKELRARAIKSFKGELEAFFDPELRPTEFDKLDRLLTEVLGLWRRELEEGKVGGVGLRMYRRIDLLGPEKLNKRFEDAVRTVYNLGRDDPLPPFMADMAQAGKTPHQIWRRANNRIRQFLVASELPLSDKIEHYYGAVTDTAVLGGLGRWGTVAYQLFRFVGEARWLALEAVEPFFLTGFHGGIKPILEGTTQKAFERAKPVAEFGHVQRELAFRHGNYWAQVADMEQATALRSRLFVREIARRQTTGKTDFRGIVEKMAREDPGLAKLINEVGDTPQQFLDRLDRDWRTVEHAGKSFATQAEASAFYKPWLDAGVIDQQQFRDYVDSRRYHYSPEIEAEIARAKTVSDPVAAALYERLGQLNHQLIHDVTATMFGQENRSNLQRALNHPFLYWPISYQIKATKWLLRFMLEEQFGVDGGALGGLAIQRVYDEHRRRMQADEIYREKLTRNKTLYFMASMFLPIAPWDLGVSLSPWSRMILNPDYNRPGGVLGFGWTQSLSFIGRLIEEQTTGDARKRLQQAFPVQISTRSSKSSGGSTSEAAAEEQRIGGALPPVPIEVPAVPRLP